VDLVINQMRELQAKGYQVEMRFSAAHRLPTYTG
jgi:hypothetical protein